MLCLSRELGESIVINENVKVTLLKNRRGGFMLGVEAPREIPVRRQEIDHDHTRNCETAGSV
jgi:carbon storage regulator